MMTSRSAMVLAETKTQKHGGMMKRYEIWLKLDGKDRQETSAASTNLAKREAKGLKAAYARQYPNAKIEVEVRDLSHDATEPGGKVIFTA